MTCPVRPNQFADGGEHEGEVTHACPIGEAATTPCCDKSPFELPPFDRLTVDDALVTCGR